MRPELQHIHDVQAQQVAQKEQKQAENAAAAALEHTLQEQNRMRAMGLAAQAEEQRRLETARYYAELKAQADAREEENQRRKMLERMRQTPANTGYLAGFGRTLR